jgi:long-chain acyl-CoA synthetase
VRTPLVGDVLERAVALYGDRTATVDGDVRLTYRESEARVRRLAAALLGLGVPPGAHVGILAANSHRYFETYFLPHWSGTPLLPLNTRLSAAELAFILEDGEVRALFVGPEQLALAQELHARCPGVELWIALGADAPPGMVAYDALAAGAAPLAAPARDWAPDDMLHLCYTGGTTGRPKGVMLSHRNVVANVHHAHMVMRFAESDRWLHVAPMFHLADAWACYAVSLVGGLHVFLPSFAPDAFLETVERERITVTILVPTMINFVVNHPEARARDLRSLRLLVFGASPMPADRLLAARELFGPILCQAYGMTETAPFLTSHDLDAAWGPGADPARLASCGRAVPGVSVRVVGADGKELPAGEPGEVVARGPNVMLGYWKRPEETANALRDGWMHTGDVGRMDAEGFLTIVDRAKDMIITGGENVYSTEVESALYEHPAVLEAAVIGVPDLRWGEAVHAIVVPREGAAVSAEELIAHCHARIAGYKCPKSVELRAEALPKSGPGKILKSELRRPFWAGRELQVS